jgi:hypothetical protein
MCLISKLTDIFVLVSFNQIYCIKFYVIIGFLKGGPGGATFTTNGLGGTGSLGGGNGLPRFVLFLIDDLVGFDFFTGFLFIPGSPSGILEK